MTVDYATEVKRRTQPTLSLVISDTRFHVQENRSEEPLSDCWPDWSTAVCDPDETERSAERNSPGKVLFEVGALFAAAAFLVIVVTLFVPPP
jgi:hypothetical protein